MIRRIEANKSLINKFDPYGYSPLHYAAQHNHLKIVNYLLINGAKVNANSCGATPLHRAGLWFIVIVKSFLLIIKNIKYLLIIQLY